MSEKPLIEQIRATGSDVGAAAIRVLEDVDRRLAEVSPMLPDIEVVAAMVHDAWMAQKRAKGITSAPSQATGEEQMRPYAELSHEVQEYDRATVRAVYSAIEALGRSQETK